MKKSHTEETSAQPPAANDVSSVPDDTVRKLQERIQELESQETFSLRENLETLKLTRSKDVELKVNEILSRYFTPEHIAVAISFKSVSSKAYRYLRKKLKHPLPDISTLRKWAREFERDAGILHNVVALMNAEAKDLGEFEKNYIKISSDIYVDRKAGKILGPHKLAQVVMVRSLLGKWKQPIYYDHLVDSDVGGGNRAIWKQLGINTEKTYFPNPNDQTKNIFVFADVPHLLKLKGFVTEHGETIYKMHVQHLLEISSHDFKLVPNLTQHHLDVKGSARQKVKTAAQLFSNRVYGALIYLDKKNAECI
ncbi:hypothetical protein PR048_008985 [Dryococelus australis]|uniref:Transposase n=1 Tax=Dryococelus australis TaxID=614101 RepID=A0ABQ9HYM4_9NEOP|nr:hypothetical protein PR048_008985 [Dryococelus australis]